MKSTYSIYTALGKDGYELCHPINLNDFEMISRKVNASDGLSSFMPISVQLINEDLGQSLSRSDSPWLGSHALIFRANAAAMITSELIGSGGDFLPLICADADLVMYNPPTIDALDEEASSVRRFNEGGIIFIQAYEFIASAIENVDAFRIPNLRVSPTFLSDKFVERWETSGLTGLEFTKVWSSSN